MAAAAGGEHAPGAGAAELRGDCRDLRARLVEVVALAHGLRQRECPAALQRDEGRVTTYDWAEEVLADPDALRPAAVKYETTDAFEGDLRRLSEDERKLFREALRKHFIPGPSARGATRQNRGPSGYEFGTWKAPPGSGR